MSSSNYWDSWWKRRYARRRVLAGGSVIAAGAAGLALVGCGDDDDTGGNGGDGGGGGTTPTATATQPPAEQPKAGGILRTAGGPVGSQLDIHKTNTPYESAGVWHWAGNFLVRFGAYEPNVGLPEADLAETLPEITDDGTTLIFTLNPAATWQNKAPVNGRAVDAEDVKLTFERIMNPDVASPRAGNYSNIDTIEVVDDRTVRFRLKAPQADLLSAMSDQYDIIIPKELAQRGADAIMGPEDVIGSGPYELASFEAGQRFSMRRRPDGYWKPNTAWLEGWDHVNQVDPQQLSNALRAGEIDSAGLPVDLVREYEGDPNYYIVSAPNPTRECLLINHNKEPYTDPKVRQAIWRAINRTEVYQTVYGGGGIPGGPMTPAAAAWVLPDDELSQMPGFRDRETELKEARDLLAAAGFPDGFSDSILTVTAFNVDEVNDVIVSNLAEVGIQLTTENVGTDFFVFLGREVGREYNVASTLFLSGPYPDAQLLLYHHSQFGSRNYGDFSDPEIDALLEQQRGIYDMEERLPLVHEIQRKLIMNPGPAWIGSRVGFTVVAKHLKNVVATPFLAGFDDAENVWLDRA